MHPNDWQNLLVTCPPDHQPVAAAPTRAQVGCGLEGSVPSGSPAPQASPATSPGEQGACADQPATGQTLLFELFKQGQAADAGPREHDVVLAGRVPAQAPGHRAV